MNHTTVDIYWTDIRDVDDRFRKYALYVYGYEDIPLYIGKTAGKSQDVETRHRAHKGDGVWRWMSRRYGGHIYRKIGIPYYRYNRERIRVDNSMEIGDLEKILIVTEVNDRQYCGANVQYQKSFSSDHCRNLVIINHNPLPLRARYEFLLHAWTYRIVPDNQVIVRGRAIGPHGRMLSRIPN